MEGEEEVMDISLKDLSKKLEEFAKARDWEKYHSPRNLLLAMVIMFSFVVLIIGDPLLSPFILIFLLETLHYKITTIYFNFQSFKVQVPRWKERKKKGTKIKEKWKKTIKNHHIYIFYTIYQLQKYFIYSIST